MDGQSRDRWLHEETMKSESFWGITIRFLNNCVWMLERLAVLNLFLVIPAVGQIHLVSGASIESTAIGIPTSVDSIDVRNKQAGTINANEVEDPDSYPNAISNGSDVSGPTNPTISLPDISSHQLTFGDRFHIYGKVLVSPPTVLGPALGAAVSQWRDEPPEWRQGAQGYGRRFASGYGRNLITDTISFGMAAADGEDPRYFPSKDTGIWPRTRHAIVSTFVSSRENGDRGPAWANLAGIYGAALLSNVWYPSSRVTVPYTLERGSTALASNVAFHVLREFWPDIRKLLPFKAR